MTSTAMERAEQSLVAAVEQPIYWPKLLVNEQAFVASYVENGYSLTESAQALSVPVKELKALLNRADVRRAITEVQAELDSIDFLNEKWVKTQLLRLYPKVMGDEPVPMVNNLGEEMEARKFMPDIVMRIMEYVAPKTTAGKGHGNGASVNVQINLGAMGVSSIRADMQNG